MSKIRNYTDEEVVDLLSQRDFFKDEDPVPQDAYEIGPLDWTIIQDSCEEMELEFAAQQDVFDQQLIAGGHHTTIKNPDVNPLVGSPTDDKWTYGGEYEKKKKLEESEKIDYEKDSENFVRSKKNPLTNKEKADILNKIIWSN